MCACRNQCLGIPATSQVELCAPPICTVHSGCRYRHVWPSAAPRPVRGKSPGHKRSRHQEEGKHAFARSRSRRRTAREKRCYISPRWVNPALTHTLTHEADSRIDHTHCTEIFATEMGRPVELYTTSSLVPMELMCTDDHVPVYTCTDLRGSDCSARDNVLYAVDK